MVLSSENLYLKSIEEIDTADIIRWRNTECVRSKFIYQDEITKEGHSLWINNNVKIGKVIQFIIMLEDTNKGIGSVYINDINFEQFKGEFGIFIGEIDYMGKGLGYKAAKLIIHYAFEQLGLKIFI